MLSFDELKSWLHAVSLVHHIPGRIRLKLTALPVQGSGSGVDKARGVQAVLEQLDGIRSLRVNLLARSCTIEYDPAVIPPQGWPDYLGGRDTQAAHVLDAVLRRAYQECAHAQP